MSQQTHLFKIAGKVVVGGLNWRPMASPEGSERRAEIKGAAAVMGSRHGAVLEGDAGEVAIGFLSPAAPKGATTAFSAASWLAQATQDPTFYIERLPTGQFWLVLVRDHFIDPRTDILVQEAEAISIIDAMLVESLSTGSPLRIVLAGGARPNSTMLDRFEVIEQSLAELLRSTSPRATTRVRQLVGITPAAVIALATLVVVLMGGYGGLLWWKKIKAEREFEEQRRVALEQQRITEELNNLTELRMVEAVNAQIQQDTATPPPSTAIRACLNAVGQAGLSVGGWSITAVSCDVPSGSASAALQRRGISAGDAGTNATLLDAAARRQWGAMVGMDGATASLSIPSSAAPSPRPPLKREQLPPEAEFVREFASTFQRLNHADASANVALGQIGDRNIIFVDPTMQDSQDPTRFKTVPPERSYRQGTFTLSGSNLTTLLGINLDQPYLKLDKIDVQVAPGRYQWSLSGVYLVANH